MEDNFEMLRSTQKLYYNDQYLMSSIVNIVRIHSGAVELDATVAYPEGGGQEADSGTIECPAGTLRFVGAKKLYGTPIHLQGFKGGKLGGIILHVIHPADLHLLDILAEGMRVRIRIDALRRERLTLAHSASHFLYAAATGVREELKQWTTGCHIKEDSARFDFLVEDPFSADEIHTIESQANYLISLNQAIGHNAVQGFEDARMWSYEGIQIPCGGTHLDRPQRIGNLKIRRKRLGKGKERLICEFPDAVIDTSHYHERDL
ncbi:alanyl-tRNA editing protein [Pseudomonas viridiflava]|uniref:Alanyl-transfer RNA synthetases family profile domain-containing protein n=1 Tax=Pseudomonas viridiflava TaxID=33069 RepID=A0A3M5P946_PSEVI|nr:alanyl-tRNA editing protein [Pseudomonas viridiflava]MBA1232887.1 alanyl-tRNA editing protein [Pseudomonas viridiflava]RMT81052.1 hypothetical protein ALP40_03033 [Pseudomonas viridiflava]